MLRVVIEDQLAGSIYGFGDAPDAPPCWRNFKENLVDGFDQKIIGDNHDQDEIGW